MWPLLLDMTKEESIQNLRNLELETYSNLVSVLRAQGPLNPDKRKLLKETSYALNISQERHKAEVRRALNDEKLNTIAYHVTGHTESTDEWAQEGRRIVPLLPRTPPQTIYSSLANDASESASQSNKMLPLPANTERKRPIITSAAATVVPETSKNASFRIPELPKSEDGKKRKLVGSVDNNSITQHLLAPKLCRIQQLYRQRSKPKTKELKKLEQDQIDMVQQHRIIQPIPQTATCSSPQPQYVNQRLNVLQNISLQPIKEELVEHEETDLNGKKISENPTFSQIPFCPNENQAPKPKIISNIKPSTNITIKHTSPQPAGPSSDSQKTIKVCPAKKPVTKAVNSGQKLIVVSNAQSVPPNSILQRTLQIPFVKNISIKNFEKFKIVTSNSTSTNLQLTNVNSGINSVKHKVVTVKTNPSSKKVIPLSQLQVLNSKGNIKVLPLGGKIVGKSMTGNPPLYIVNSSQQMTKVTHTPQIITSSKVQDNSSIKAETANNLTNPVPSIRENGKSSVLEDILKASGVISEENIGEDYDTKIEEFHIPYIKDDVEKTESSSVESEVVESESVETTSHDIETTNNDIDKIDGIVMQGEEITEEHIDQEIAHKMEVASNEVIESENTVHLNSMSEEIMTEEVPIDMMIDFTESKISDTECN